MKYYFRTYPYWSSAKRSAFAIIPATRRSLSAPLQCLRHFCSTQHPLLSVAILRQLFATSFKRCCNDKRQNFHEAKIQSCSGMLRNKGAMETRIMALWLNYSLTELLVQFIILYGIRVDDLEFKPHLRFTSHLKSVGSCLLRESL